MAARPRRRLTGSGPAHIDRQVAAGEPRRLIYTCFLLVGRPSGAPTVGGWRSEACMDLSLDEASRAAQELVTAVLARHPGLAAARAAEPLGHDPKLWAQLCEAGLPGLAVAEEHDGGGAGLHA